MSATLADVALRAGVSNATVSRFISGKGYVGNTAAEKIAVAIEELGFTPNRLARSLLSKRSWMIGFVVSQLSNPFWAEVVDGIQEAADRLGYCTVLYNTGGDEQKEVYALNLLKEHQVEGFIVTPPETKEGNKKLLELKAQGIPVVLLGREVESDGFDNVVVENEEGALAAVMHLANLGHIRIAFVFGEPNFSATKLREKGYLTGLKKSGLQVDPDLIVECSMDRQGGADAMVKLLSLADPPTAIFANSDVVALGAMQHAILRGVMIPGELSIVGFDDIILAGFAQPGLTTIAQPKLQLGRSAVELLHSRIQQKNNLQPREVRLQCKLIKRDSTSLVHNLGLRIRNGRQPEK